MIWRFVQYFCFFVSGKRLLSLKMGPHIKARRGGRKERMFTRKIAAVIFYLALLGLIYVLRDELLPWLESLDSGSWTIILFICAVLGMVPVIPFALVSGILGIKYGLWGGSGMSVAASTLASVITYWIFANGVGGSKKTKLKLWNEHIQQCAFQFVLIGRMLPFIPAALINGYAGWFKLPFISYVTATALGKIPTMLVFAYVGVSVSLGFAVLVTRAADICYFFSVVYLIYNRLFQMPRAFNA